MTELEAALGALRASNDEAALRHLLEAWREIRAPRLAAIIDRVSARITEARGPVRAKRVRETHALWAQIEARRDPADLERLLQVKLPSRWREGKQWVEHLGGWPDDPRLARGLSALFANKPYDSWGSMPFWHAVLRLLVRQRDIRAVEALRATNVEEFYSTSTYRKMIAEAIEQLEGQLPDGAPELEGPAAALCGGIEALMQPEVRREEQAGKVEADFLAEIFAAPERDEPRLVFADWLTERGDPRGELIVLQCSRPPGASPSRRERELLKENMAAWCGALHPLLRPERRRFERGFLVAGIGRWGGAASIQPHVGEPWWATVQELTAPERAGAPAELVAHPVMRSLRVVHNLHGTVALALDRQERPLPLEEIGFINPRHMDEAARAKLGRGPGLPSLRRIVLTGVWGAEELGWLWESALVGRLQGLALVAYHPLERITEYLGLVESRAPRTLSAVRLMGHDTRWPLFPEGWCVTLRRDAAGRFGELEAEFGAHQHFVFEIVGGYLALALEAMAPEALTSIVVEKTRPFKPTAEQRAALARACRRFTRLERLELPFEV